MCKLQYSILIKRLIFIKSAQQIHKRPQVAPVQPADLPLRLTDQLGVAGGRGEKFLRRDAEVVTDAEKRLHGRERIAGSDIVNVAVTHIQIQTHPVFGHIFLHPQLCDPLRHKGKLHDHPSVFVIIALLLYHILTNRSTPIPDLQSIGNAANSPLFV